MPIKQLQQWHCQPSLTAATAPSLGDATPFLAAATVPLKAIFSSSCYYSTI